MKMNEQTGQLEVWFSGISAGKKLDKFLRLNNDLQIDEWIRFSNGSMKVYFSPIG